MQKVGIASPCKAASSKTPGLCRGWGGIWSSASTGEMLFKKTILLGQGAKWKQSLSMHLNFKHVVKSQGSTGFPSSTQIHES